MIWKLLLVSNYIFGLDVKITQKNFSHLGVTVGYLGNEFNISNLIEERKNLIATTNDTTQEKNQYLIKKEINK